MITMTPVDSQQSNHTTAHPQGNGQPPTLTQLLRMTFEKWYADNMPRHAAALAFYTLFAVAPLLLLSVAIMGTIFGRITAEIQLKLLVEQFVHRSDAAALAQTVVENALPGSTHWLITIGLVIALLYGASNVFGELQIVLNIIWGIYQPANNLRRLIWERAVAILMVILSGLLIFLALVVNFWFATVSDWVNDGFGSNPRYEQVTYFLLFFVLIALVFAIIYKFVPHVKIAWHDVLIGAVATAFLVSVARLLITWYLSYSRFGSIFGAAGSLVILLLWVYYSAQIFFLGAEFTHIYSRTYGARRRGELIRPSSSQAQPTAANDQSEGEQNAAVLPVTVIKAGEAPVQAPIAFDVLNLDPVDKTWRGRWRMRRQRLWQPIKRVHSLLATVRQRGWQLLMIPAQIIRPIREIVMAVGIIGTLSVAALIGIPWRKRRITKGEAAPIATDAAPEPPLQQPE